MNNVLIIPLYSRLHNTLDDEWETSSIIDWGRFLRSIDNSIVDVSYNLHETRISFTSEEHKNWFSLKYA